MGLCTQACKRVVHVCVHACAGLSMCMLVETRRLCQAGSFRNHPPPHFFEPSFLTEPSALATSATHAGWQFSRNLFAPPYCTPLLGFQVQALKPSLLQECWVLNLCPDAYPASITPAPLLSFSVGNYAFHTTHMLTCDIVFTD